MSNKELIEEKWNPEPRNTDTSQWMNLEITDRLKVKKIWKDIPYKQQVEPEKSNFQKKGVLPNIKI